MYQPSQPMAMNGYWDAPSSSIPLQPPLPSSQMGRSTLQPPVFPDSWQSPRPLDPGYSSIPMFPMPPAQPRLGNSYPEHPQGGSRFRSRSAGPPTYHSIRSLSPQYHAHDLKEVHPHSTAKHGTLTVRLTKAPSTDPPDSRTIGAMVEVAVGPEKHRVPFPEREAVWDHMFSFSPVILPKDGLLACADHLSIIVWEAEGGTAGKVARDRAKLDLSHLTCGHPSVFIFDLCGHGGFTLEAIAVDFGEPQFRACTLSGDVHPAPPNASGIGKLKVAMLRQLGFPPGKQIAVELAIGSKKITTNACPTTKEQLGDKFTFFVKLRASALPGVQVACHPLVMRVVEDGSNLLGIGTLDLSECVEQQIMRRKVDVKDEAGHTAGVIELAVKPVNFGRKDSKYRLTQSPSKTMSSMAPHENSSFTSTVSSAKESSDGDLRSNIRELQAQLIRMKEEHAAQGDSGDAAYQAKLNVIMAQLDRAQVELDRILARDEVSLEHYGDRSGRSVMRGQRNVGSAAFRSRSTASSMPSEFAALPPRPPGQSTPRGGTPSSRRSRSAGMRSGSPGILSLHPASESDYSDATRSLPRRRKVNPEAISAVESFFGIRKRSPSPSSSQATSRIRNRSASPPSFTRPSAPYSIASSPPARSSTLTENTSMGIETRSYYIDPRTGQVMNSIENVATEEVQAVAAAEQVPRPLAVSSYYRDPETGKELTQADMMEKWGFTLE